MVENKRERRKDWGLSSVLCKFPFRHIINTYSPSLRSELKAVPVSYSSGGYD
jgi:hypothetical protein